MISRQHFSFVFVCSNRCEVYIVVCKLVAVCEGCLIGAIQSIRVNASTWHVSSETTNSNVSIVTSRTVVASGDEITLKWLQLSTTIESLLLDYMVYANMFSGCVICLMHFANVRCSTWCFQDPEGNNDFFWPKSHGPVGLQLIRSDDNRKDTTTQAQSDHLWQLARKRDFFSLMGVPVLIHTAGISWIEFA